MSAMCTGLLVVASLLASQVQGPCACLVWLTRDHLDRLAQEAGVLERQAAQVSRDEAGKRLFLNMGTRHGTTTVCSVSESGAEIVKVQGGQPIFGDDGKLVCYHTNHTMIFRGGQVVRYTVEIPIPFSPGREILLFDGTRQRKRTRPCSLVGAAEGLSVRKCRSANAIG